MSLVTRAGTLLRSHPYSESSRILRFLTPEAGVVAVMARGARKQASKGGVPLDLFDDIEIVYNHREGHDLHTLREFRSLRRRQALGKDLLRFSGASFLAELVLGHTLEEASPALHERLVHGLDEIMARPTGEVPGSILAAGWSLLTEFGFPPSLDFCIRCGRAVPPEEGGLARFDLGAGGLRCPDCASGGTGPRLGPVARDELRRIVRGDPPTEVRGARAHFHLLERFALHHLDRRRAFQSSSTLSPLIEGPAPEPGERTDASQ